MLDNIWIIIFIHLCMILLSETRGFNMLGRQKTLIDYTLPKCHPGILSLFNWCEQSDCQSNCTCINEKVCKQICENKNCEKLHCHSAATCHQSVLRSYYVRQPQVKVMYSQSPISQQDCSQGKCNTLASIRYKDKDTSVFQSCSEGVCENIMSNADQIKQFCGKCSSMTCFGENSKNCTQLCVIGNCTRVACYSKNCKQMCSHDSTCNLQCGPDTKNCYQECSFHSRCNFDCRAINCKFHCDNSSNCTYQNMTLLPTGYTTTMRLRTEKKSSNRISSSIVRTKATQTSSTLAMGNEVDRTPQGNVWNSKNNTIASSSHFNASSTCLKSFNSVHSLVLSFSFLTLNFM